MNKNKIIFIEGVVGYVTQKLLGCILINNTDFNVINVDNLT